MSRKKPIDPGEPVAWNKPFAALLNREPAQPAKTRPSDPSSNPSFDAVTIPTKTRRGRVDIIRQTAHRGGKTVTVITGFTSISPAEMKTLAKEMQSACGAGGTVKEGRIEIQGDHRDTVSKILTNAGFRPVFAGG